MKVLIVDDDEFRHEAFRKAMKSHMTYSALNSSEFNSLVHQHRFDAAFLDHDLGDDMWDGKDAARQMAAIPVNRRPSKIFIHTWNFGAAIKMESILRDAGYGSVVVESFSEDAVKRFIHVLEEL